MYIGFEEFLSFFGYLNIISMWNDGCRDGCSKNIYQCF